MRVSLSGKFSLLFRHFRGRKFLKARIIPQRIEKILAFFASGIKKKSRRALNR